MAVGLVAQLTPAIAAAVLRGFGREGWVDGGFRRASPPRYLRAWALGAALPLTAAAFAVLLGWGRVGLTWPDMASRIGAMGLAAPAGTPGPVLGFLLTTILVFPFLLGLFALAEEIGWRGYVLPRLLGLGRRDSLVVSGLLWAVWHVPYVLAGGAYPGQPIVGLLLAVPFYTSLGIILGHLRLQSGSVFVTALAHGTLNATPVAVTVLVAPTSAILGGFTGPTGIAVASAAAAWLLWRSPPAATIEPSGAPPRPRG